MRTEQNTYSVQLASMTNTGSVNSFKQQVRLSTTKQRFFTTIVFPAVYTTEPGDLNQHTREWICFTYFDSIHAYT